MMKLINQGTNPLRHGATVLAKGVATEVPDEIAEIWLTIPGVEKYVAPADLTKVQAKAEAEAKAKDAEIAALKAEIEKLKTQAPKEAEAKAKETKTKTDK